MRTASTDLSLAEWGVLGVVAEGETHGFAIARRFAADGALGRVWTVPRPLVYRAIDALIRRDFIRPVASVSGGEGPTRRILQISSTGTSVLEEWLVNPVEHVRDARSLLMLKLLLLERSGRSLVPLVDSQRQRFEPMLAGLRAQLDRAEGFDRVLAQWRLHAARAAVGFLDELAAEEVPGAPG